MTNIRKGIESILRRANRKQEEPDCHFEFDSNKSNSNLAKHGIDFEKAQELWLDNNSLELPGNSVTERRHLMVGMIGSKCYTAVFTLRDEAIRIISLRRSRRKEIEIYESNSRRV